MVEVVAAAEAAAGLVMFGNVPPPLQPPPPLPPPLQPPPPLPLPPPLQPPPPLPPPLQPPPPPAGLVMFGNVPLPLQPPPLLPPPMQPPPPLPLPPPLQPPPPLPLPPPLQPPPPLPLPPPLQPPPPLPLSQQKKRKKRENRFRSLLEGTIRTDLPPADNTKTDLPPADNTKTDRRSSGQNLRAKKQQAKFLQEDPAKLQAAMSIMNATYKPRILLKSKGTERSKDQIIRALAWWSAASSLLTELDLLVIDCVPPALNTFQQMSMSAPEDREELAADVGDQRRLDIAAKKYMSAGQSFTDATLKELRLRLSRDHSIVGHIAYSPSIGLLGKAPAGSVAHAEMLLNFEVWYVWATTCHS